MKRKLLLGSLCILGMLFVQVADGASEEEITKCAEDLKERMDDMKSWLVEHLQLGSEKGCDRDIINRKLTSFGMAKIECDKAGTNTLFDFPAKEYQAWDAMCPRPAPPEFKEGPPERDRYSKEKSQPEDNKEEESKSIHDKKDGEVEIIEEDEVEPQVYPGDDEL